MSEKKLIEVALPLEAINRESAREKSIRHGHPSTLHLWWARRPLAACRAILFSSLVDDPSVHPDRFPTEATQEEERQRLFRIIEELVKWENTTNETVLQAARAEILRSCDGNPPPILDPFCGGGSIPLEAQRLGLEAHASDLNPVAVLITKALIELPPRFAGQPPVHPMEGKLPTGSWKRAQGLAEDLRFYGKWMRNEAQRRIGQLYPNVKLLSEHGGGAATVVAWLWARTVKCSNPACGAQMPLVQSFALSTKAGREVSVRPVIDRTEKSVHFEIISGPPPAPSKVGRGANFRCLVCQQIPSEDHIKNEGRQGRMSAQLMAIAAHSGRGRIYLAPQAEHEDIACSLEPSWSPDEELAHDPRAIWCIPYGLTHHRDLYTARQLVALSTFSDLVGEARALVLADARTARSSDSEGYANAVATYLACLVDAVADDLSSVCSWRSGHGTGATRSTFARQGLPMVWDFAEANPFAGAAADLSVAVDAVARAVATTPAMRAGEAKQLDATAVVANAARPMVCTDPPYYDNIGYADLSDFFYVWLRRALGGIYPQLFSTLLTPKQQELVATPHRFSGQRKLAEKHFEDGLAAAFARLRRVHSPEYPLSVFYAFKQAESQGSGMALASTGWEKMLEDYSGLASR